MAIVQENKNLHHLELSSQNLKPCMTLPIGIDKIQNMHPPKRQTVRLLELCLFHIIIFFNFSSSSFFVSLWFLELKMLPLVHQTKMRDKSRNIQIKLTSFSKDALWLETVFLFVQVRLSCKGLCNLEALTEGGDTCSSHGNDKTS